MKTGHWIVAALLGGSLLVASCGGDGKKKGECDPEKDKTGCDEGQVCIEGPEGEFGCFCDVALNTGCDGTTDAGEELVCENVQGAAPDCFPPIFVQGRVFDLATDEGIEGAHVVARDANNAAESGVAVSEMDGGYQLRVPVPRNAEGQPLKKSVTLRADAAGYLGFPKPPRIALPIELQDAAGSPRTVQTSATDVGLVALENTSGLGAVSGTVLADRAGGTLVVAGGSTGVADIDGSYTVFNVSAGSVDVSGFKAGLNLSTESAEVTADETTEDVDLELLGDATATVSGKVEIVNPGMGDDTSVILVLQEGFDMNAARGEAPPGLRTAGVTGAWSIPNVPDGDYWVLAAFENDFLTRDPDTSIGGTELVPVTVSGSDVTIDQGFKVTGSLDVVSPDDEEVVSGTPTFVWSDDSSEVNYEIRVFDAFGNLVWEDLNIPSVSGSATVEVQYGGPALESGMLYQFRATSIKRSGAPIATTEDLRGVFLFQ